MADNTYMSIALDNGSFHISDDVIAGIVRPAVLEVEGVQDLASAAGSGIAEYIGISMNSKGIRIRFDEDSITVDVIVIVKYGYNIVEVARKVQTSVCSEVESMTGFDKINVNVNVAGIAF